MFSEIRLMEKEDAGGCAPRAPEWSPWLAEARVDREEIFAFYWEI